MFFQSREQMVVHQGQIQRIGWVIKTLEAQVGQFLLGCKCPVSRGIVVQEQNLLDDLPAVFFLQNVLQLHPHRWVILHVDSLALWKIISGEDGELFQRSFALGIFWDGVSCYATIPLTVPLSLGHSDITRFHPWSPIVTENHLDHAEKIPKVAQTTGTVDVDPHSGISGPTSWRASARPNLHEWCTQPAHVEMPSCSAIDLAKIQWSSKISSWIWSIISGLVTVLGRPGRGTSQVEKSPRSHWATQFLTVAYKSACSPNVSVRMAWISFGALLCRKKTWWQLTSPCCWNRMHCLTCFLWACVTRKDLQLSTWADPYFQRHYWFHCTTSGSRLG